MAVGSRANLGLLEKLGATARISPNDSVGRRCLDIAATLGSPALEGIKVDGGDAVYDVVGVHDIHFGERLLVTGRYRGPATRLVVTASGGYRREIEVTFPAKEEGNNYVRRLWAQREIADLLALPDKKAEVTALGVKHQVMTPYTSFLVLENEQMWKDHQLQREVQKGDKLLAKEESKKAESLKEDESFGNHIRTLLQEGTELYKKGRYGEASGKFEEAFEMKPSSDQVFAFMKRAGDDVIAGMMNNPDRKMQDAGRRMFELSKPGDQFREGKAVVEAFLKQIDSEDPSTRKVAAWHLKNLEGALAKSNDPQRGAVEGKLREYNAAVERETVKATREAEMQVFVRQMEVQLAQNQELMAKFEEHRSKLAKALDAKALAVAELQYARQSAERLSQDLAELQTKHVEMARDKKRLEEKLNHLNQLGGRVDTGFPQDHVKADGVPVLRDLPLQGFLFGGQEQETDDPAAWDSYSALPSVGGVGHSTSMRFKNILAQARLTSADEGFPQENVDMLSLTTGVTVPGAPITDAWPVMTGGWDAGLEDSRVMTGRLMQTQANLAKLLDGKGDLSQARRQVERLSNELAELETKHVDMARGKMHLEEKLNHLNQLGVKTDIAPMKPLEGKVTAVANEIGLVVISIGKDVGVMEGDEFTVYRGGDFVAKIQIDRADRRWSAGKVVLKKSDPRVADDVSNHIYISSPRPDGSAPRAAEPASRATESAAAPRADGLGALSTEVQDTDGRTLTLKLGLQAGTLMAITRDHKFVAAVLITETVDGRSRGLVWRGIAVDAIRRGDQAQVIANSSAYVSQLPEEVKKNLASRRSQQEMRAKLGY